MATACKKQKIRLKNPKFDPDPNKNVVITKLFAPKFCAERSNREVHSSHGDPFREKAQNWPWSKKKCRHHKVVCTEILCRMVRLINSQLSWRPFSWTFLCFMPVCGIRYIPVPSKALRFNNPTRRYAGILIPSKAVCRYGPVWLLLFLHHFRTPFWLHF